MASATGTMALLLLSLCALPHMAEAWSAGHAISRPVQQHPRLISEARRIAVAPMKNAAATFPELWRTVKDHRGKIKDLEKQLREEKAALQAAETEVKQLKGPTGLVVKETAVRSLAKAVGWRITAGLVTFCTSYYFTGNLAAASAIVGSDFVTKSGTMYVGERLFNKVQIGRSASGENPMRSVVKAVIWRLFAAFNTMVVSIIFAKEASVAAKIAGVDSVVKTILMIIYDQAWSKVDWGKELENTDGDGI